MPQASKRRDAGEERIIIPTERCTLELIELWPNEAEQLFKLIDRNRSHLSQWGDDTAAKYPDLPSVLNSLFDPPNPYRFRFGIWDGQLIGRINLTRIDHRTADIGYWVGKEFSGRCVAIVATRALVRYAFQEAGYRQLKAQTHEKNIASQKVLWRSGFKLDCVEGEAIHFVQNK